MSRIEILHVRDPDSACEVRVWVDGVETTDFEHEDIDPGRGYVREDWQESRDHAAAQTNRSEPYRDAVDDAYAIGAESEHIMEG